MSDKYFYNLGYDDARTYGREEPRSLLTGTELANYIVGFNHGTWTRWGFEDAQADDRYARNVMSPVEWNAERFSYYEKGMKEYDDAMEVIREPLDPVLHIIIEEDGDDSILIRMEME